MQELERIKNWLDKMELIYFESSRNFNWSNILTTIKKDMRGFIEDGGWNIILGDSEDEEDE